MECLVGQEEDEDMMDVAGRRKTERVVKNVKKKEERRKKIIIIIIKKKKRARSEINERWKKGSGEREREEGDEGPTYVSVTPTFHLLAKYYYYWWGWEIGGV